MPFGDGGSSDGSGGVGSGKTMRKGGEPHGITRLDLKDIGKLKEHERPDYSPFGKRMQRKAKRLAVIERFLNKKKLSPRP